MLSIKVELKGAEKFLNSVSDLGKQVRYAAAVALTRTARQVSIAGQEEVAKVFDKPTPFIRRAIGFTSATKQTLAARVFVKDRQQRYLLPHITGGGRPLKPFEQRLGQPAKSVGFWVPGPGVRLNTYGNIPLATIKQIAAQLQGAKSARGKFREVFVGVPKNQPQRPFAVWAKTKSGGLVPLLIRIDNPNYTKRFDFQGIARRVVGQTFENEFNRALKEALGR